MREIRGLKRKERRVFSSAPAIAKGGPTPPPPRRPRGGCGPQPPDARDESVAGRQAKRVVPLGAKELPSRKVTPSLSPLFGGGGGAEAAARGRLARRPPPQRPARAERLGEPSGRAALLPGAGPPAVPLEEEEKKEALSHFSFFVFCRPQKRGTQKATGPGAGGAAAARATRWVDVADQQGGGGGRRGSVAGATGGRGCCGPFGGLRPEGTPFCHTPKPLAGRTSWGHSPVEVRSRHFGLEA